MDTSFLSSDGTALDYGCLVKRAMPVILLAIFWCWETWAPYFGKREDRLLHAARNLTLAVVNWVILAVVFGWITTYVADWAERHQFGLLHALGLAGPVAVLLGLVLLDCWMYVWHRANHTIPLLWRFHRMHHSDTEVDVTSATRFHLGEHVGSSVLRLGLIPLLGVEVWTIVIYDTLVFAVTQFHHADINIGYFDRWLRWLIVTPYMHKVHHSDWQPETDSNYSTVLSIWDRVFGSFRMRSDPKTLVFGLHEYTDPSWQSLWGMTKTPFVDPRKHSIETLPPVVSRPTENELSHAGSQ
jgi:sterol desaturase/sphingolipid hydroxylase (fatty acid hydroxylase superfamily)